MMASALADNECKNIEQIREGEWIAPPITQEMLDAGIRVFYGYGLSDGDLTPGFRPAGAAGAVAEIYRVMRKHEISALMKEKAA